MDKKNKEALRGGVDLTDIVHDSDIALHQFAAMITGTWTEECHPHDQLGVEEFRITGEGICIKQNGVERFFQITPLQ